MLVSSILAVLHNFEGVIESVGGSKGLREIQDFTALFAGRGDITVSQLTSKLMKGRIAQSRAATSPPIRQLQELLAKLQKLLASAESLKSAEDISKLILVLEGCGQASVTQFVAEAQCWLISPPKKATRTSKSQEKKGVSDVAGPPLVHHYADTLKRVSMDNGKFDELLAKLRADKKIRKNDMREIAERFLGHEIAKKKGRQEALEDIIDRQALEARQEGRGRNVERQKSW
jgi:hypothetical protein